MCNLNRMGNLQCYINVFKKKTNKRRHPLYLTLNLSKINIAEKYAYLPQDFKNCFWSNAELRLKEFKKIFRNLSETISRNALKIKWHERIENKHKFIELSIIWNEF